MMAALLLVSTPIQAQESDDSSSQEEREATENQDDATAETENNPQTSQSDAEQPAAFRRLSLPPPTNLRYAQQQKWDIERTIAADAYEMALVNNEEILFVINEANLAITKGVAILIGEAGHNSLSQGAMSQLAEPLNDYGWVTVMVPAPTTAFSGEHNELIADTDMTTASQTTEPKPNSSAMDTSVPMSSASIALPQTGTAVFEDTNLLRHEEHLIALMEQVVTYSSRYPGFFLVIAKGTTAAFLAKLYSEQRIGQPDALVALGAYWPEQDKNKKLAKYLGEIETPVLDLYNSSDTTWAKITAKQRRIGAERALKLHYRQREIVGQAYDSEQYRYIAKEIYGWLTYMGW